MLPLLLMSVTTGALGATLSVGEGGDYTSIQAAIDDASDGDTVLIGAGTWLECVELGGRSLTLEGAGSAETVLDGGGLCEPALLAGAGETVTVRGLHITNAGGRAVELADATASFQDVSISDSGQTEQDGGGILAAGGDLSLEDCTITDSLAPTCCWWTPTSPAALPSPGAASTWVIQTASPRR